MQNSPQPQTQTQPLSELAKRMKAAWTPAQCRELGPSQGNRLDIWVARDRAEHGEDFLTVPVLQGMMEDVLQYYPEIVSRSVPL